MNKKFHDANTPDKRSSMEESTSIKVVSFTATIPPLGSPSASGTFPENTANENNGLKLETNHSRQRKRTERNAIKYLDNNLALPSAKRRKALIEIRAAKQPKRTAKGIIERHNTKGLSVAGEAVDLSRAQEVIVKLIRRDGGIWEPQATLMRRLQRDIIEGMTSDEFTKAAAVILGMPQVLPDSFLKAERGPK